MLLEWFLILSGSFLIGLFAASILSISASEDAFHEGWVQGVRSKEITREEDGSDTETPKPQRCNLS